MLFTVTFSGFYPSTPPVGYTLYNADGTLNQARTTAGVVNPAGNVFQVTPDTLPNPCSLVWDDGGSPPNYAATAYNGTGGGSSTVIVVNDNLNCGS